MQPLITYNLLQSIQLLGESARVFTEKCIRGIEADESRCAAYVDKSLAMATYLVPLLGYDRAAELSQKAHQTGKTIREVVVEEGILTPEKIDEIFSA